MEKLQRENRVTAASKKCFTRMYSSRMRTARLLPYGGGGVSVQEGLCPGGSLSRGLSVQGVSVGGGCLSPGGVSVRGGGQSRAQNARNGPQNCQCPYFQPFFCLL